MPPSNQNTKPVESQTPSTAAPASAMDQWLAKQGLTREQYSQQLGQQFVANLNKQVQKS